MDNLPTLQTFMEQNRQNQIPNDAAKFGTTWNATESFRSIPNTSESFGKVPQASEAFRTVRNDSASFRNIPHPSEKKENHTLTVREAARIFEAAGVARTERSIVNWCQPNRTGIARLDSYFDPNERKYYISPQSLETAIQEEIQKATKFNEPSESLVKMPQGAEGFRTVPNTAETEKKLESTSEGNQLRLRELEMEIMDLRIVNKGKDYFIERLQKDRENMTEQVISASRKVGELEAKLLQLERPN